MSSGLQTLTPLAAAQLVLRYVIRVHGAVGSGNFGHAGRPGEVGGSSSAGFRSADPKKDADRLKALRIPPAWKNVRLNPDPNGALQATGTDVKGRTQYRYSAAHSEAAAAEKFERLTAFNKALPQLRSQIEKDLGSPNAADREAASVLYLIDKTGFRIGSDRDTLGEKDAYGASTLEASHVSIHGSKIDFAFTGKKGVDITKTVDDAKLAAMLRPRVAAGGKLFNTDDKSVRDYLGKHTEDFTPKDFRTWHGTNTALQAIRRMPVPKTEKAFVAARKEVGKAVAQHLGNTPTVALASYIDPAVFRTWNH